MPAMDAKSLLNVFCYPHLIFARREFISWEVMSAAGHSHYSVLNDSLVSSRKAKFCADHHIPARHFEGENRIVIVDLELPQLQISFTIDRPPDSVSGYWIDHFVVDEHGWRLPKAKSRCDFFRNILIFTHVSVA